jgi:ubiquinone/menaquinone biosynthesis C-methylase UbiE
LEIDPTLIRQAQHHLQGRYDDRLRFAEASISATGLPDDSFDFAVARLIFQHLPDPAAAAEEMLRVLRPGGKLAIIDIDDAIWGVADPAIPEMDWILERYGLAQAARGGNRLVGRRLWSVLAKAGFGDLQLEAIVEHSDALGLDAFLPQIDPDRLLPLVNAGLVSNAEIQEVRKARDDFLGAERPYIMVVMLMACGTKP